MVSEPSLRLLVLGIAWPPETFVQRLIRGLTERDVDVIVGCHERPDEEWLALDGFHWMPVPHWGGSIGRRMVDLIVGLARSAVGSPVLTIRMVAQALASPHKRSQIRRLAIELTLLEKKWDVVYFPWNSAAIEHLPSEGLWDDPVVISCRGSQVNIAPHDPERASIREGLCNTFRRAATVHCVSEDIKQKAMRYGLDPEKACVIRPAVDTDFFSPPSHPRAEAAPLKLVTTGSLVWGKGLDYALLSMRHVIDRGTEAYLDIIGDGPEKQRVLYTTQDLGLEGYVSLLGHQTPAEVRNSLRQADVFVLSSLSEGISNAVLEAMACGLPIVTTDCGGMNEAVQDGVHGLVVPVREPEHMAQALIKLANDPELRDRMGRAARDRVLKEFDLRDQAFRFAEMLRSIKAATR